jgi:hypothetical protein
MARAILSFMLPVGFVLSTLTKMRAPFGGTTLRSSKRGVFPIVSRIVFGRGIILSSHYQKERDFFVLLGMRERRGEESICYSIYL